MKLDKRYSHIYVCPETDESVSTDEAKWGDGAICSKCGHVKDSLFGTHAIKIPGRWNRPTFWESVWHKKKMEFFRKEDEDELMDALKQDYTQD